MDAIEQQMAADLEWARTAPDVQKHVGKMVVVHKKRVVAITENSADRETIVQQTAKAERCPPGRLVVVIVPSKSLREIPH